MRITRQMTAKREVERAKDSSRRRNTRQDTAKRILERAIEASRNKSKRRAEHVKRSRWKKVEPEPSEKLTKRRNYEAKRKAKARSSAIFGNRESQARLKYRKQVQEESLETKLEKFRSKLKEGPTCICVCCGSLWFRSSVQSTSPASMQTKHDNGFIDKIFHVKCSDTWICRTCYSYTQKGKVPRLALWNGLDFPEIPDILKDLTTLEERLVALRLPFL